MKIKNLILIVSIFAALGVQAQRGTRIGYINMEYILQGIPEYQEASSQLENKVNRWKKDIERMNSDIEQLKLNLSNERVLLTEDLIEEREEEIAIQLDEMLTYQQARFGPNGDLDIQRRQLIQPIQDQVFNIVQEIADNKRYDFIFDKSSDVVMLFAAKRHDISDLVLRQINRAAKREEASNKKEKKAIEKEESLSLEEESAINERKQAIEDKKNEREARVAAQRKLRDSIQNAKRAELEARKAKILAERQKRRDSILNARKKNKENNNNDN